MSPTKLNDYIERWDEFVPDTEDLSLMILKGHLLIEEMLSELLDNLLPNSKHLMKMNLGFRARALIARAACPIEEDNNAWDLVMALNKTRNELIHNLDPPKLEQVLSSLFSVHSQVDVFKKDGISVDRSQDHLHPPQQRISWAMQDSVRFLAYLISSAEKEKGS